MPMKSEPNSVPMATSTMRAFVASGFVNAGTPLATASVPVSATDPEENARRIRNAESASVCCTATGGGAGAGRSPVNNR